MKPLKKTPAARMWVRLRSVSMANSYLHRSKVRVWKHFASTTLPEVSTYPLPKLVYPHQNKIGSMIMKQVWVPKFAEIAKYESRAGDLRFA
jgi:hypothetical protein